VSCFWPSWIHRYNFFGAKYGDHGNGS